MRSDYKTLSEGYLNNTINYITNIRENYETISYIADPTKTKRCGGGHCNCISDRKDNKGKNMEVNHGSCDICTLPLTQAEYVTNKGKESKLTISDIPTSEIPTKDQTTYQVCKSSDSSNCGGWCKKYCVNGAHLCNNKYIYADTDVDGLTRKAISSVPNVNACYTYLSEDTSAAGIVYDKSSKNCYLIDSIPGMKNDKLSVTWAYNKTSKKPYHNENAVLILKK